jgi:uncharacterized protein
MRMDRSQAEGPVISGFSDGGFRIDDNVYRALLITPRRADGWSPPPIDALGEGDLAPLLGIDPRPEFILLGTGPALVRPPLALTRALEARGVGVEAMDSRAAARAWGVLRAEQRWIAAALYALG